MTEPTTDIQQDTPALSVGQWTRQEDGWRNGDWAIGLESGDPTRWCIWNASTGTRLCDGEVIEEDEQGRDIGLHARVEQRIDSAIDFGALPAHLTVDGLEPWCEEATAAAVGHLRSSTPPSRGLFGLGRGTKSLIRLLIAQAQYMHFTDPDPTLIALAGSVSSAIEDGEPLWLMTVAASSSGKGETLRIADDTVHKRVKDLTLAGLLSNRKVKGSSAYVATGLLPQIQGESAVVSITDFSALLSPDKKSGGAKMEIFNALRDIYDGAYSRTIYGGGAEWSGRLTLIAACTSAIDQFAAHSDSLGTRWLYFRMPSRDIEDRIAISRMSASRTGLKEDRAATAAIAKGIVDEARRKAPGVELDGDLEKLIVDCAVMTSYGRSSVPREQYGTKHEICDMPDLEEPGRVTHQLRLLARSLVAMEVDREIVKRILRRAALSSMTAPRALVLSTLFHADGPLSTNALHRMTGVAWKVADRAAEDLEVIGLIHRLTLDDDEGPTSTHSWAIAPDRMSILSNALGPKPD